MSYPWNWIFDPENPQEIVGFTFSTKFNLVYNCTIFHFPAFENELLNAASYTVSLYPVTASHAKLPFDPSILQTVNDGLRGYFGKLPSRMLSYQVDIEDGRGIGRTRYFAKSLEKFCGTDCSYLVRNIST